MSRVGLQLGAQRHNTKSGTMNRERTKKRSSRNITWRIEYRETRAIQYNTATRTKKNTRGESRATLDIRETMSLL